MALGYRLIHTRKHGNENDQCHVKKVHGLCSSTCGLRYTSLGASGILLDSR